MKPRLSRLLLLVPVLLLLGASCGANQKPPANFTLQYWTVYTNQDALKNVIAQFELQYPYITVQVKQFSPAEYESKLIDGWAHNQGPDIFSIPNGDLGKFETYISPLPASLKLTSVTVQKGFAKKQTTVTTQNIPSISIAKFSSLFPQIVYDDVVLNPKDPSQLTKGQIYGIPLSMDTLALYYNKDLLDKANIPLPATKWTDFDDQVTKLTLKDKDNNIIQAGVGLGTSKNVPHAFDILSLLMLQNGTIMAQGQDVLFDKQSKQNKSFPGVAAVTYYTSFADAKDNVNWYSWNSTQPNALDNFIAGKSAFYIGYHFDLAAIQSKAPNLNFDVAPIPQNDLTNSVNYPNYWLETVANTSAHYNEAWSFLQNATTNETNVEQYLATTKQPAALKVALAKQANDYILSTFNNQTLTAKDWYHGSQPTAVQSIFSDMIDLINGGKVDVATAVKNAAQQVNLTFQNK